MAIDPELLAQAPATTELDNERPDWIKLRNTARASLPAFRGDVQGAGVKSVDDFPIPGVAGSIAARLYRPINPSSHATLHYIHGGGFVAGDLDMVDHIARRLCRHLQIAVISTSYRRAPEHIFPAAYEDCLAAAHWVLKNANRLGGDQDRVFNMGESAGGNLAAGVTIGLRDGDDVNLSLGEIHGGRAKNRIAAMFLAYPWLDVCSPDEAHNSRLADCDPSLTSAYLQKMRAAYLNGAVLPADNDPRLSPYHVENICGLPSTLIVVANPDPLSDEAKKFALRLREAGGRVELLEFDRLLHGFFGSVNMVSSCEEAFLKSLESFKSLTG